MLGGLMELASLAMGLRMNAVRRLTYAPQARLAPASHLETTSSRALRGYPQGVNTRVS